MQLAADLPVVTLLVSVIVLVVCTTLLSVTVPALRRPRWRAFRRRRRDTSDARRWRAVTGRPPSLPAGPPPVAPVVRRPPRQEASAPHVQRPSDRVSAAEATIEHLLDTDPDRLARLMMNWIRTDDEPRDRRR